MKRLLVLAAVLVLGCDPTTAIDSPTLSTTSPDEIVCAAAWQVLQHTISSYPSQAEAAAWWRECMDRRAKALCKPCRCGRVIVERLDGGVE